LAAFVGAVISGIPKPFVEGLLEVKGMDGEEKAWLGKLAVGNFVAILLVASCMNRAS
jgi:hypothetical protein